MENASKALLMAAGVLIGIVVLSLAAYLFVTFSESTSNMEKQMEDAEIVNFNNQFMKYNGKDDLTIYDVYTVRNLAYENNKKYELENSKIEPSNFYIAVLLNSSNESATTGIEQVDINGSYTHSLENYDLKDDTKTDETDGKTERLKKYECSVQLNENTGRVNRVIFKDKKETP